MRIEDGLEDTRFAHLVAVLESYARVSQHAVRCTTSPMLTVALIRRAVVQLAP